MCCVASVGKVSLVLSLVAVLEGRPVLAQEPAPLLAAAASIDISAPQVPQPSLVPRGIAVDSVDAKPRRPKGLIPLYGSFAALQVLDVHSTTRAIDRGAIEMNPLMKGIAGSPVGMLAVKAGATTGMVYASERIWKRNKTAAVLFMIAANSAMGWVVQHNYRAVR